MSDAAKDIVVAAVQKQPLKVKELVSQTLQQKATDLLQQMKPQIADKFLNQPEAAPDDNESE